MEYCYVFDAERIILNQDSQGLKDNIRLISALAQQITDRVQALNSVQKNARNYAITDVHNLVTSIYDCFGPLFPPSDLSLYLENEVPRGLSCMLVVDLVRRAIENLLSNSIKFTDKGGKASYSQYCPLATSNCDVDGKLIHGSTQCRLYYALVL